MRTRQLGAAKETDTANATPEPQQQNDPSREPGTSVVSVIEDTLSFQLLKAMKLSRPTIWPVLAELGLHPGQDLLLSALWREDGITQAELVARLGVEAPTVSKALQRLERAGYVRRDPARGRTRRVFLTEAGRDLRRPVEQAWRRADRELHRSLTPEERATLKNILNRLTKR